MKKNQKEECVSKGKRPVLDLMTKEEFVECWLKTGQAPDDPFLRKCGVSTRRSEPVEERLRTAAVAETMWKIRQDRKALVNILRRPTKIAECLEEFNLWRRGKGKYSEAGCEPPYSAYMIGKIIEGAVNRLYGRDTEVEI